MPQNESMRNFAVEINEKFNAKIKLSDTAEYCLKY